MSAPGGTARLAAVTAAWIAVERLLAHRGARYLPDAVAAHLTLQTWLLAVQLTTACAALVALALWVPAPGRALGLARPSARALVATALLAPIVFSATTFLAFRAALPTLLDEAMRGGMARARENAGEIARSLTETEVVVTVAWGIVVAPIVEELVFRGALWSVLARAFRGAPPSDEAPPASVALPVDDGVAARGLAAVGRWLRGGGGATLVTAAIFAALHADLSGGAGILRVGVALGLGLATGLARQLSGGLAAPVALHVLFNFMSVSGTRRWVVTDAFPMRQQVPTLYAWIAAGCAVALVVWAVSALARRRAAQAGVS